MEKINNIIMENPTVTLLNIVMLILYTIAISKLNKEMENSKNEGIFIFMGIILTIIYGLTVYVSIQL
ncbi:hypothetical protein HMPREF9309_00484 [Campylobacter ureolyticus ACS-301-V-Sch3b]|uniref:Uncharacterized protein n=1 Tax=Campylobacter ureolyticus ACS-301-V-Sch3b TaxID=883165 RepID=S3XKD3_9BACT|nr:hypothetical protein [Campylobacter ureolyticus]EPH09847.1 hypothetical protein HMPREF9309_00484 [Campylobacter ureolyticus ACS-301-V-Sch3b]